MNLLTGRVCFRLSLLLCLMRQCFATKTSYSDNSSSYSENIADPPFEVKYMAPVRELFVMIWIQWCSSYFRVWDRAWQSFHSMYDKLWLTEVEVKSWGQLSCGHSASKFLCLSSNVIEKQPMISPEIWDALHRCTSRLLTWSCSCSMLDTWHLVPQLSCPLLGAGLLLLRTPT